MYWAGAMRNELFWGGLENDTADGGGGHDLIYGAAGDDVLLGRDGNDGLLGGDGADYLIGGTGNDVLNGGSGIDWADYADATRGVRVDLNKTRIQDTGGGGRDWLISIERLAGSAFADVLTGNSGDNLFRGGAGADSLYGGGGSDSLIGDDGDDLLNGGTGADYMQGGAGNDTYHTDADGDFAEEAAGGGIDTVVTGVTDRLDTNVENLRLTGTAAINGWGNTSDNVIWGNAGANTIYGYEGNDSLYGGEGDDTLGGGDNDDRVDGGAGSDTFTFLNAAIGVTVDLRLQGVAQATGRGVDTLVSIENVVGSDVADVLIGNAVANRLEGMLGADTYRFFGLQDLNGDVIVKAAGLGDRIDLSGIDANAGQSGDQAFTLVSAFTGQAGQAVYATGASSAVLRLDVNGDGAADASLTVLGTDTGFMGFVL